MSSLVEVERFLDSVLPITHVVEEAEFFLDSCNWQLVIGNEVVSISTDAELVVRSRAFIKADLRGQVFLDDHFEAVVLIGKLVINDQVRAKYGVLRMYFNLNGQFVSEDRYDKYQ